MEGREVPELRTVPGDGKKTSLLSPVTKDAKTPARVQEPEPYIPTRPQLTRLSFKTPRLIL